MFSLKREIWYMSTHPLRYHTIGCARAGIAELLMTEKELPLCKFTPIKISTKAVSIAVSSCSPIVLGQHNMLH